MTPEANSEIEAVQELFDRLCERPSEERETGLAACSDARVRRQVARLLEHYDRTESPLNQGLDLLETTASGRIVPPKQIGPYRVRSLLGTGGMGVVFLAEQQNPQREVAVKVLQASWQGGERARRFEREAQLLGRLQHPGIAQIFESGATSESADAGTYIAMEYVDGRSLTRYASERSLSTEARTRLLVDLADAIHHAHLRGVLHRDLKPSNVLVTSEGQVKVIDFGVARAMDADDENTLRTVTGQVVGTLAYMSPEQVRGAVGDVDARADVYALGVMAYEMFSGELPFDLRNMTLTAAAKIVCDVDAALLGTRTPACRGDLEQIVAKAMEKEPERRYQSAAALGDDLRRFLDNEPVLARPASAIYQLRKVARRNRALVAGTFAAFAALLVGGSFAAYYAVRNAELVVQERDARKDADDAAQEAREQAEVARRNADEAEANAERARELADELDEKLALQMRIANLQSEVLSGIDLAALGGTIRDAVLADARAAAERAGPRAWTSADAALAEQYLAGATPVNVGRKAVKESFLDRFRAEIDEEFRELPLEHFRMLDGHAFLLMDLGFYADAAETHEAALAVMRESGLTHDEHRVGKTLQLANALMRTGEHDRAVGLVDAIEGQAPELVEETPHFKELALTVRATVHGEQGRYALAEELFRELVELSPGNVSYRGSLAASLLSQGRAEEAEAMLREVLDDDTLEPDPRTLEMLGICRQRKQDANEAAALFEEAIRVNRGLEGDLHPNTLRMRFNLASALVRLERYPEAADALQQVIAGRLALPNPPIPSVVSSELFLAKVYWEMDEVDEANRMGRSALDRARRHLGEEHPLTQRAAASVEAAESSD